MKESGLGRENGLEAYESCVFSRNLQGVIILDHRSPLFYRFTKQVNDREYRNV